MPNALVLGVDGQDGSYLRRHLVRRGYTVSGVGRRTNIREEATPQFEYVTIDLRDVTSLESFLASRRFDVIFHLAAVHGSANTIYESVWQDMLAVNVGSVHVVLENARSLNPACRLIYASSCKVFSAEDTVEVSESTAQTATCLYTITKNASRDLISYYRKQHGIHASILYLSNHESELRPADFFIPRIVSILGNALRDSNSRGDVQTLEFCCDWGSASEYMDLAIDIAERNLGEDFLVATGATRYAREFVAELFDRHKLDYSQFVHEQRPVHGVAPIAVHFSIAKLNRLLGRTPIRTIFDVVSDIVSHRQSVICARQLK